MVAAMPQRAHDPSAPVSLRVGDWDPARPYSPDHSCGKTEAGLSVYDLDPAGSPVEPAEGEWAHDDLRDRLLGGEPKHVVQGLLRGEGHDGEPLLSDPAVVGEWREGGWVCGTPDCPARHGGPQSGRPGMPA